MTQFDHESSETKNQEVARSLLDKMNLEGISDPERQRAILEEAINILRKQRLGVAAESVILKQTPEQPSTKLSIEAMLELIQRYTIGMNGLDRDTAKELVKKFGLNGGLYDLKNDLNTFFDKQKNPEGRGKLKNENPVALARQILDEIDKIERGGEELSREADAADTEQNRTLKDEAIEDLEGVLIRLMNRHLGENSSSFSEARKPIDALLKYQPTLGTVIASCRDYRQTGRWPGQVSKDRAIEIIKQARSFIETYR